MGVSATPSLAGQLSVDGVSYVTDGLKIVENLGLMFFVTAVGFIAGPTFLSNFKKNFKSYVCLGLVIILFGALACVGCILIGRHFTNLADDEFTAILVGLLAGALTSTPAFSAAKATVATAELESLVSVGYGIAYLFGVVGGGPLCPAHPQAHPRRHGPGGPNSTRWTPPSTAKSPGS